MFAAGQNRVFAARRLARPAQAGQYHEPVSACGPMMRVRPGSRSKRALRALAADCASAPEA